MKKIMSLSAAVLLAASNLGFAGGFEELRAASGLGAAALESVNIVEAGSPEPAAGFSKADGQGAVRLFVTADGGVKASAGGIYSARKDSYFCTEFSWNEGSGGRVPKRIYPQFGAQNGLITIPEAVDSGCDYRRVNEGSLSFSIPGRAEAYNSVAVLRGGSGNTEQRVECKVIRVDGPDAGEKLSCYGDVRLDASNQARIRVVMGKEASFKSAAAPGGPQTPADFSGDKLVEFGSVCDLGKNPTDAVSGAMLRLNEPIIRLQTNVNVWTSATYTGTYVQAPYRVLGEASVTRISAVAKYNWLACIPVQGRIR